MKEVIEVMSQIAEGNLSVAIKGDYKGNYAILANTVNATVEVLNNVIDQIGMYYQKSHKGILIFQQLGLQRRFWNYFRFS